MEAGPTICSVCHTATQAVIVDLKAYNEHKVPVWYCPTCDLSLPVMQIDRHAWVDAYAWDPPGFAYGAFVSDPKHCIGCDQQTRQADIDLVLIDAFPFWEARQPSWVCYRCGFTDRAIYANRHLWADHYKDWK